MIKKVIAILASVVMVLATILASAAPVLADDPVTWPSVRGFDKEDFFKIAESGFGDPMNNYVWSMTYFKGDIYVGTGRNIPYMIGLAFKSAGLIPEDFEFEYITHPREPAGSQQWAEDMRGEIWRHGSWERVYLSPVEESRGEFAPRHWGFRQMVTFDGAIYAASGGSFFPGQLLLRSTDGISWEPVLTPLEMGTDSRAMVVHNAKLYVGTGYQGRAEVWELRAGGNSWKKVADFSSENNVAVTCLESFNGYLYAGTTNLPMGYEVWRSNARTPYAPELGEWTRIVEYGGGDLVNYVAGSMEVFKNKLYVGSMSLPVRFDDPVDFGPPKGFELIRISTDDSWELIVGDYYAWVPPPGDGGLRMPSSGWPGGFANLLNWYCWSLQEYDGVLYLGSFDASSFLQFLPIEEIIELPQFDDFAQAVEDNKEEILICLGQIIDDLEGLGADEEWIEPLRLLMEALEEEPTDWVGMWQVFIDYFAGADLWKTEDGIVWEPVTLNGFDNPNNYGFRALVSGSLYVGTANPFQGCEVWQAPPYVPPPVGGEAYPVDKISLLAPWIAAGVFVVGGAIWYALRRRKAQR